MHTSPWRLILPLWLFGVAVLGAGAQQPSCSAHLAVGSTPLDSAIVAAMIADTVPGAALAVVRDGRVERLAGYGCANIAGNVPVDPRTTVFHVASVSKPFVALAAMQLAERGAVDLHADVNRYLRGVQVPAAWNRPITLHDLLTHTAGLDESIVGYAARTPGEIRPLGDFLAAKLPNRGWAPGDITGYSNYGYALAGYLVESIAGKSFAEYERSDVLQPLGMTHSSFVQPPPPELARDAALSYRCRGGRCEAITPDYRSAYPPGGLVTTAEDMSRFLLAQLAVPFNGKRTISDSILRLMHARQFTLDPALPGLTYGFSEDSLLGARALSHAGGASGYSSFVFVVPDRRVGVFLVSNGAPSRFGATALAAIVRSLDSTARTAAADPFRTTRAQVDPGGSYRLTRYAHRGVENLPALFSGQLHVRHAGGDTISILGLGNDDGRYVPVASNRWRSVDGRAVVAVRAENGRVTHLFGPVSFFGTRFPSAFERLAWYDEPYFLNELLSYVIGVPLLALLAWPVVAGIVWMVRRRTRLVAEIRRPLGGTGRVLGVLAAVGFTALGVWFGFGFIAVSNRAAGSGGGEIVFGLPPVMQVLAFAPAVLAILAVVLLVAMVMGGVRRWWSIPGLVIYTVVALNAVLFVAILVHWGYFPVASS